jgi:DNA-binding MarR family transcriptional regulator
MHSDHQAAVARMLENLIAFHRTMTGPKYQIMEQLGVTRAQLELLLYVHHHQPATVGDIAQYVRTTSSAATQLVEGLERLELVQRQRAPQDRRVVEVSISPMGDKKFEAARQQYIATLDQQLAHVSVNELSHLANVLERIIQS